MSEHKFNGWQRYLGVLRGEMMRLYHQVGAPFMINAGCEIPSGTPPENLRALCEPIPC